MSHSHVALRCFKADPIDNNNAQGKNSVDLKLMSLPTAPNITAPYDICWKVVERWEDTERGSLGCLTRGRVNYQSEYIAHLPFRVAEAKSIFSSSNPSA